MKTAVLGDGGYGMVDYIGTERIRALLRNTGIATFLEQLAGEIETDYRRWSQFERAPRHASHSSVGVIELMPASDGRLYSFKYVNGHPKNTSQGLLTVTAFGVLADVATGYPLLLAELTYTTALRTAAMSALAARWMANRDSCVMALIGNGAQSEFQAIAFYHLLGIRELRLFDVDQAATEKLEDNLEGLQLEGMRITKCRSIAEAVCGSDIITTATADKRNAVVLTPEMIEPGVHINAIGGDCPGKTELHPDILQRPDVRIVVELEAQSRVEGEIQQLDPQFPVIEFADIVSGRACGRCSHREVTIFDSVGFALEDFSALRYLHRLLLAQDERSQLDLVPHLANPKNLFAGLRPVLDEPRLAQRTLVTPLGELA
jgi:ornithine cyclodeaminase